MKHSRSVRTALLFGCSAIILLSFCAVAVLYIATEVPKLKEQTLAVLTQNSSAIASAMDLELEQMSTVALNIAYSTQIKDHFFSASLTPR
ncbi:MAG: hypothetical protein PHO41_07225, partial [Eubacteriales bacterium]|nr:hypothetical protein [Eubacteriales bacterium]